MDNSIVRVLLVDDHTLVREGIASLLRSTDGIEIVGGLSSGEEAVNNFMSYKPNVILLDVVMARMSGFEATRWIKEQDSSVKIIIVSSEVKKEFVTTGIKCGIDGYLHKDVDKATLIEAIHTVMQNKKYFNATITNLVFEDFCNNKSTDRGKKISIELTNRENEVLEQVASGKSNKEVAETLFISIKTVETHKGNILGKLGLKNMAELVKYAIKNKIIDLD